jgi:hypothetical protein
VTRPVTVVVFHPEAGPAAGPLGHHVAAARRVLAERHRTAFLAAGASEVRIITGRTDDRTPFGERLADLVPTLGPGGLLVLGSGAVPLARATDYRELVAVAAGDSPSALANNRYSADVVALADARSVLVEPPELSSDNGLPRWLEARGVPVDDRRDRWRLGVDIDGPLDLVLLGGHWAASLPGATTAGVRDRLTRLRSVVMDPTAEVVVAGRTSPAALRWLERSGAARTRALVEERGMRTAVPGQRPPRSLLGLALDDRGPGALGTVSSELGDAALVDSRVLLAHRHGGDTAAWPPAEDRFASDLLLAEDVVDPWLRELTAAARDAPIPVLLGGHTLVGPGLRLAIRGR